MLKMAIPDVEISATTNA